MKKCSSTLKIVGICLILQAIQAYYPQFILHQVFNPNFLDHLNTLPFFLIGLIVHMFSHAGWDHLLGNMTLGIPCMLYVEHCLGSRRLLNSYVMLGVVAALGQALVMGGSGCIGASGAIFGLLGMCCMLIARKPALRLPAIALLCLFLVPQLLSLSLSMVLPNIAYAAHISGMVGGLVLASFHLIDR